MPVRAYASVTPVLFSIFILEYSEIRFIDFLRRLEEFIKKATEIGIGLFG